MNQRKDIEALRARLEGTRGREYWRSLEAVSETAEFKEYLHREFPQNASEWLDPVGRRGFLKLMSASLALAGVSACTRQPTEELVPYVRQPEEIVPGTEELRVAVHARLRRRDAGEGRRFDGGMTVLAVDTVVEHVVQVAELNRLFDVLVGAGDVRRPAKGHRQQDQASHQRQNAEKTDFRECIGAAMEDLRHQVCVPTRPRGQELAGERAIANGVMDGRNARATTPDSITVVKKGSSARFPARILPKRRAAATRIAPEFARARTHLALQSRPAPDAGGVRSRDCPRLTPRRDRTKRRTSP